MSKIAIIGGGGWGTALALVLAENNHSVSVWEYDSQQVKNLIRDKENKKFLPGVKLPENIMFTNDLEDTVADKEYLLTVVPSHVVRDICEKLKSIKSRPQKIITATKGIENKSLKRMSEIIQDLLEPDEIAAISGPSHAEEVARKIPTVIVVGALHRTFAVSVQKLFNNSRFRVYYSTDILGIELGGALKNVIAIAAGICDGAGFGDNTKAALITRGIVEISRIGKALGAENETFSGLSGLGDLIVTCASRHSRNRYVGEQIGLGKSLKDVLDEMDMVAEGVKTTASAYELVKKVNVEAPITNEVYKVLFMNKNPLQALNDLMTRELKAENIF